VLQLKPASRPEDIPAINDIGVGWCHAAERDPHRPEQRDDREQQSPPSPPSALVHLGMRLSSLGLRLPRVRLLLQGFASLTAVL
jgi:hypothetical protein